MCKWSSKDGYTKTQVTDEFVYQFAYASTDDIQIVAVMSDGVGTFDGMEWYQVVDELMNFKNIKGHFVQRRMKRFMKDCQKKGVAPYDDVSVAAIYLGE